MFRWLGNIQSSVARRVLPLRKRKSLISMVRGDDSKFAERICTSNQEDVLKKESVHNVKEELLVLQEELSMMTTTPR